MKDLVQLEYLLGIEVARSHTGIYLCQHKYVLDIIVDSVLLGTKPASHPIEQNHQLGKSEAALLPNPSLYQCLVGRLIYLGVTRPDLSYAIHCMSQFMHKPTTEHWDAALRVIRYLKGNLGQGILLCDDSDLRFSSWCDSDWAACSSSRRSLTAWFIQLGSSLVSWKTRKRIVSHGHQRNLNIALWHIQ